MPDTAEREQNMLALRSQYLLTKQQWFKSQREAFGEYLALLQAAKPLCCLLLLTEDSPQQSQKYVNVLYNIFLLVFRIVAGGSEKKRKIENAETQITVVYFSWYWVKQPKELGAAASKHQGKKHTKESTLHKVKELEGKWEVCQYKMCFDIKLQL